MVMKTKQLNRLSILIGAGLLSLTGCNEEPEIETTQGAVSKNTGFSRTQAEKAEDKKIKAASNSQDKENATKLELAKINADVQKENARNNRDLRNAENSNNAEVARIEADAKKFVAKGNNRTQLLTSTLSMGGQVMAANSQANARKEGDKARAEAEKYRADADNNTQISVAEINRDTTISSNEGNRADNLANRQLQEKNNLINQQQQLLKSIDSEIDEVEAASTVAAGLPKKDDKFDPDAAQTALSTNTTLSAGARQRLSAAISSGASVSGFRTNMTNEKSALESRKHQEEIRLGNIQTNSDPQLQANLDILESSFDLTSARKEAAGSSEKIVCQDASDATKEAECLGKFPPKAKTELTNLRNGLQEYAVATNSSERSTARVKMRNAIAAIKASGENATEEQEAMINNTIAKINTATANKDSINGKLIGGDISKMSTAQLIAGISAARSLSSIGDLTSVKNNYSPGYDTNNHPSVSNEEFMNSVTGGSSADYRDAI